MNCKYCGSELTDGAAFCTECGKKTGNTGIRLSCTECGAALTREGKSQTLVCPYCGSKRILKENDSLIRSQLRAKRARDLLKKQGKEEKRAEAERRRIAYSHSWGKRFTILGLLVCFLMVVVSFSDERPNAAVIAIVQSCLLFVSWMMGMQIIPTKNDSIKVIPRTLAILLILPFLLLWDTHADLPKHDPWPTDGIAAQLPVPENLGTSCEVRSHSSGNINVSLKGIQAADALKYIEQCKEAGFTLDPFNRDSMYKAFNEAQYELEIRNYDSIEKMYITLKAPIELTAFTWPEYAPYNLLPTPECNRAKVATERENCFEVILGDFDRDAFNAYVSRCIESGFSKDYRRGEDDFIGFNENGVELMVEYVGLDRMKIYVYDRVETTEQ